MQKLGLQMLGCRLMGNSFDDDIPIADCSQMPNRRIPNELSAYFKVAAFIEHFPRQQQKAQTNEMMFAQCKYARK